MPTQQLNLGPPEKQRIEQSVLKLQNVSIVFHHKHHLPQTLVHHLTLDIRAGETFALVGESGSGKSITALSVIGLLPPSMSVGGERLLFKETDLLQLTEKEHRRLRHKEIAFVFQDYRSSFTPFLTIGKQMVETIQTHLHVKRKIAKELALSALKRVGLPAERAFASYPFQLSGGQLQRAALATALMLRPSLLIADEPSTALDVLSAQHVLALLQKLKQETQCAVLLISHNLNDVLKWADRIGIMYGGMLVEQGDKDCIQHNPQHPYTQLLLQSKPSLSSPPKRLVTIPGEPGLVADQGCPFALRCPYAIDQCHTTPPVRTLIHDHHEASCHLFDVPLEKSTKQEKGLG